MLTVADLALAAYEPALEPKRQATLTGGPFDAYDKEFDKSAGAAEGWFTQHLAPR